VQNLLFPLLFGTGLKVCANVHRSGGVVDVASAYISCIGSLLLALYSDASDIALRYA